MAERREGAWPASGSRHGIRLSTSMHGGGTARPFRYRARKRRPTEPERAREAQDHCGCVWKGFRLHRQFKFGSAIWRDCRHAILVNTSRRVERSARRVANVLRVFPPSAGGFQDILLSMRFYQWTKNLLLFVPAITSHTIFNGAVAGNAALAFFSFGFAASAAYILNDLLDLEEDRRHPTKKQRPFAAGRIWIGSGIALAIASLAASAVIAGLLPGAFVTALLIYLLLTSLYSLFLKRVLVIDVLLLALLYTLRVIAGHLATGVPFSFWLLSFAFFLFLSLAFSKRAADLI